MWVSQNRTSQLFNILLRLCNVGLRIIEQNHSTFETRSSIMYYIIFMPVLFFQDIYNTHLLIPVKIKHNFPLFFLFPNITNYGKDAEK